MHKGALSGIAFVTAVTAAACSSSPANFAGTYTVTVVEGPNACNFQGWTEGSSTTSIPVKITQDATVAQIEVQGGIGGFLVVIEGSNKFSGTVTGNVVTATLLGTTPITQNACTFTVNTKLDVSIDANNVLSGTLTYTPVITKSDPSCGALLTCTQQQTVSGARTSP